MQNEDGSYSETRRLVAHDVDVNNKLKISAVFSHIQETANSQCTCFGCGWNELMTNYRVCYVLSRMRFRMERYPGAGDELTITTWPEKNPKAVFTRYFCLDAGDGSLHYGSGVSQWVLFHVDKRTVVRPSECEIRFPEVILRQAPLTMPKGNLYPEDLSAAASADRIRRAERLPAYSDFDYNRHVNNARYAEWAADVLPVDFFAKNKQISLIDIKYKHEISYEWFLTRPETERAVTLECAETETGEYCIRAALKDGTECIQCIIQ